MLRNNVNVKNSHDVFPERQTSGINPYSNFFINYSAENNQR